MNPQANLVPRARKRKQQGWAFTQHLRCLLGFSLLLLGLCACGQKGALYLPPQVPVATPEPSVESKQDKNPKDQSENSIEAK